MSAIRTCNTASVAVAFTAALTTPWSAAQAAFQDPANAAWGGWDRYTDGTIFHFWDVFGDDDPASASVTDFTPDFSFGPLGGTDTITETTGAGSVLDSGNIYSSSTALAYELDIAGYGEDPTDDRPIRVALQLRSAGLELDTAGVELDGRSPDSTTELARTPFGGFGDDVSTLFLWTLSEGQDNYLFTFEGLDAFVSLDQVAVDVAPVPLPIPAALLAAGAAGIGAFRRRT